MLQTLVFDMGNVLVHFCHQRMCRQIGDVCGTTQADVERQLIDSGLQWNFERGLIAPAELHRRVEELFGRPVDYAALRHAASDIFTLNAPLVPLLDKLKQQGLRLVLLSNTSVWHFDFIRERFDVLQRFDDYVLSYEVGAIKPEPPIYEATLARLQCPPAQAFYTDDIARYVTAGREHGLHAEVFTDAPTLSQHLAKFGLDCG